MKSLAKMTNLKKHGGRLLIGCALSLIAACSACNDGDPPVDASPDAQTDAANLPEGFRLLEAKTYHYGNLKGDNGIYDIKLTPDEKTLIACGSDGELYFHDVTTLKVRRMVDLNQKAAGIFAKCKITLNGNLVYVFYNPTSTDKKELPAYVFKVQLDTQILEAAWSVPAALYNFSFNTDLERFGGILTTAEDDSMMVAVGLELNFKGSSISENKGINPLYLNKNTGTFLRKMLKPIDDLEMCSIYTLFDKNKIFGSLFFPQDLVSKFFYNLDTGELTKLSDMDDFSHETLFVDENDRKLYLGSIPSAGWRVIDLDTGKLLYKHLAPEAGYIRQVLPVYDKLVAVIQTNASLTHPQNTVTLVEPNTGKYIAGLVIDDNYTGAAAVTQDRKRLYIVNAHSLSSIDVTQDVPMKK